MKTLDEFILDLFKNNWHGTASTNLELAKAQLHKNLTDQINGYWSGHCAYHIMTHGGFLVDSERIRIEGTNMAKGKKLTALGEIFMASMQEE